MPPRRGTQEGGTGMKPRNGTWTGWGENSRRVRALLPLSLGDLGSLLFILVPYDTFT